MNSGELFQEYLGRVEEAKVYLDQGLMDQATEILKGILDKLGSVELTDEEKSDLGSRIESCLAHVDLGGEPPRAAPNAERGAGVPHSSHPSESFQNLRHPRSRFFLNQMLNRDSYSVPTVPFVFAAEDTFFGYPEQHFFRMASIRLEKSGWVSLS